MSNPLEFHRRSFTISTDREKLDIPFIHGYLSRESYWAAGIPIDTVKRSIEHSICFGLYDGIRQIGFARVITDQASFAWLADVFVETSYRGEGLGKWMMECILSHPQLQGLRRFMLATRDAHGLYAQFGFIPVPSPESIMAIVNPKVYQSGN